MGSRLLRATLDAPLKDESRTALLSTALLHAASYGHLECMRRLLIADADPNAAVDPDLKLLVYSLAAANGGEAAHATLLAMVQNPETMSEERVRILQSMGSTKDEAVM